MKYPRRFSISVRCGSLAITSKVLCIASSAVSALPAHRRASPLIRGSAQISISLSTGPVLFMRPR